MEPGWSVQLCLARWRCSPSRASRHSRGQPSRYASGRTWRLPSASSSAPVRLGGCWRSGASDLRARSSSCRSGIPCCCRADRHGMPERQEGPFVMQCAIGPDDNQFPAFGVNPRHRPSALRGVARPHAAALGGRDGQRGGAGAGASARRASRPCRPTAWRCGSGRWRAPPSTAPHGSATAGSPRPGSRPHRRRRRESGSVRGTPPTAPPPSAGSPFGAPSTSARATRRRRRPRGPSWRRATAGSTPRRWRSGARRQCGDLPRAR